ncbi:unnamed protein product, partial [Staurois parvus]
TVQLYISCPHQSAALHQVSPSHCPLTSGIPVRVPLYTQSTSFFLSYVLLRVPLSIPCAHLCPLNIKCAHQSAL